MPNSQQKILNRRLNLPESKQLLEMAVYLPVTPDFNWALDALEREFQMAQAWGAWNNGQILAFLMFREQPEAYEITALASHPEFRRQGLMGGLFQALFDAQDQGVLKPLSWWLEVHEKNLAAIELYGGLGFRQDGRRSSYYKDGSSALLMSRAFKLRS